MARGLLVIAAVIAAAQAAQSDWSETGGKTFKGEPADVIGPYLVFRTSRTSGRTVPLRVLKPEDCIRFFREARLIREKGAGQLVDHGSVFRELQGRVSRRRNGRTEPVDLTRQPEPLVYVLLWRHPRDAGSYNQIVNTFLVQYRRLIQVYPGWVEAVSLSAEPHGVDAGRHHESANLPWLLADPKTQEHMRTLTPLAAMNASSIIAVTQGGVPLMAAGGQDEEQLREFVDRLGQLLRAVSPENPQFWRDRLYFLNTVRPVEFAAGHSDPVLLGSPFNLPAMRRYGIARIRARLGISAAGRVDSVEMLPEADRPEKVGAVLGEALRRGLVFSPAVDNGKFVPGRYDYDYAVPPADPMKDAVAAWLARESSREYPLKQWLVLKTFKVEDEIELATNRVEDDGTVVLNAVRASGEHATRKSQRNAFAKDWFTPEQAAALHPVAGARQSINGVDYTWRKYSSVGHAVELQNGFGREEYCFCYAWTEIEVPEDSDAILGFGSDDGVRIWLNGELVLDRWIQRPLRIDEDVMPLKLRKGKNQLMLKVQNIWGEWRFSARLILPENP